MGTHNKGNSCKERSPDGVIQGGIYNEAFGNKQTSVDLIRGGLLGKQRGPDCGGHNNFTHESILEKALSLQVFSKKSVTTVWDIHIMDDIPDTGLCSI